MYLTQCSTLCTSCDGRPPVAASLWLSTSSLLVAGAGLQTRIQKSTSGMGHAENSFCISYFNLVDLPQSLKADRCAFNTNVPVFQEVFLSHLSFIPLCFAFTCIRLGSLPDVANKTCSGQFQLSSMGMSQRMVSEHCPQKPLTPSTPGKYVAAHHQGATHPVTRSDIALRSATLELVQARTGTLALELLFGACLNA